MSEIVITDEIRAQHAAPYMGCYGPYFHRADEGNGYPECLKRLRAYGWNQLVKEQREMLKASFDRMFGHNAKRALNLVEQVMRERNAISNETIEGFF